MSVAEYAACHSYLNPMVEYGRAKKLHFNRRPTKAWLMGELSRKT
jgi:hypothetical protein